MANPGMRHFDKSAKSDPVDTTLIGATKWNKRHYFLEDDGVTMAGTLGDLPYNGTGGLVTLLTGAQGVLTSAGSGNVPAWSMTPTLTGLTVTTITIGAVTLNATEAGFIDGVTAGTAAASKAVVLDANKDVASLRNVTLSTIIGAGGQTIDVSAADLTELRRTTNAQVLAVYNTFSSSTSYERLEIGANAGSVGANVFGVIATSGSGGGSIRPLVIGTKTGQDLFFRTNGSDRWFVGATTGHLIANGAYNIGDGAGGSPVFIYAEQKVNHGGLAFASLPSAVAGDVAYCTDSNTAVWGANVAGGGANKVLVFYNGTNWTVAGK